ncbi:hypothetical protein GCM10023170_087610 [Phytohabitans houttuyneae]|uniref:permease-like cell division protein FtsX n=1 Tax=Phytohabitans houttuyneae TaxID=1076126 RepID=UPI0031EFDCDB
MDQSLKVLFERAIGDEPLPPPGDLARQAMAGGRRSRRRRHLAVGGAAGVVAALAATFALNVTATEPANQTAMSVATRPECPLLETSFAVFLENDITDEQRAALDQWLRHDPRVQQVRYESKEAAYEKFRQLYRDAPDLVAAVKPGQLPEAFHVDVVPGAPRLALQEDTQKRAGVESVAGGGCPDGQRPGEGE